MAGPSPTVMRLLGIPLKVGPIGAARLAIYLAFFNLGAGSGIWAVFIPVVGARLEIGEGVLGLALLTIALGAMAAMPVTGWAIARYGSHAISATAAVIMPLVWVLPIVAPSLGLLFVATLAMGVAAGVLDVSMNNEAARVEATSGRALMSGFHALYSVGGLAGAGIGALLVSTGDAAGWLTAVTFAILAVAALLVRGWYLPAASRPLSSVRFTLPSRQLVGLGILAFLCFGLEGAVADWSALFLVQAKDASAALAAAGYASFSATMAVMRLVGDRLVTALGRRKAVFAGGLVIAAGCTLSLLAPWPLVSAVGFALIGIGAANVVPVVISSAARFPPESGGVSAVSTIGYVGTLSWPPVIGGLSHLVGLPIALWLIAIAGLAITFGARLVRAD
ncbi:MAG: MFS transporter [Bauldia sp.]